MMILWTVSSCVYCLTGGIMLLSVLLSAIIAVIMDTSNYPYAKA